MNNKAECFAKFRSFHIRRQLSIFWIDVTIVDEPEQASDDAFQLV